MKKRTKFILCLAMILVLSSTLLAASRSVNIKVTYDNIKVVVGGQEVLMGKDSRGKQIEPFIYNGTTYLPVRAVAEALGQKVEWDGSTKTVFIGTGVINTGEIEKKLTETVEAFSKMNTGIISKDQHYKSLDLAGNKYDNGIILSSVYNKEGHAKFNLEGKYTNLRGLLGADQEGTTLKVHFIGDGKFLQSFDIVSGQLPINVNLNVTGVRMFEIRFERIGETSLSNGAFADVFIK